jgi:hypothetical protein
VVLIREEAEAHGTVMIGAALVEGGVDEVLAVVRDVDEVLDGGPARLRQGEHTIILPLVGGGEGALGCEGTSGCRQESGVMNLRGASDVWKGCTRDSERTI